MTPKQEIGARLREFGDAHFASMKKFAEALDMRPQNLGAYLAGERVPGNKMEAKLKAMGCAPARRAIEGRSGSSAVSSTCAASPSTIGCVRVRST